jgi:hypothetical protein
MDCFFLPNIDEDGEELFKAIGELIFENVVREQRWAVIVIGYPIGLPFVYDKYCRNFFFDVKHIEALFPTIKTGFGRLQRLQARKMACILPSC